MSEVICEWNEGDCGAYTSDCGCEFQFNDEGPTGNGFEFCPFCGKVLKEINFGEDCQICGVFVPGFKYEMCCDGRECCCMGLPDSLCLCGKECQEKFERKGATR